MFVEAEPMDSDRFTEFLKECALMQGLRHGNVLELVGVCVSHRDVEGPLILVPFMENGDLKSYLSGKLLAWEGKDANYEQVGYIHILPYNTIYNIYMIYWICNHIRNRKYDHSE